MAFAELDLAVGTSHSPGLWAPPIHVSVSQLPNAEITAQGGVPGIKREALSIEQTGFQRELAESNVILSKQA